MALALEGMIAPVTGAVARPFAEETSSKLNISVVFTSVKATLAALKEAGDLASSLGGRITLIVPQIVPYPLPLESPLLTLPNLLLSGHVAGLDEESHRDALAMSAENIIELYNGRWPADRIQNLKQCAGWTWKR